MRFLLFLVIIVIIPAILHAQSDDLQQKQQVYKKIGSHQLTVDVFYVPSMIRSSDNPAMAFFHGGGWAYGKPEEFHEACKRYARKGFITFSFAYRLSINKDGSVPHPEITPVECVKDARSAIRWLKENAGDLQIDSSKIVVGGQSVGGHLSLSTVLIDEVNESSDNLSIDPKPAAILLYSATVNTMEAWADRLLADRRAEIWSISPHHNLQPGMPPTIAFHGTNDCTVPFWTVGFFKDKAVELGNEFTLIPYKNRKHYLGAGNEKYATLFDEEILERTDAFLKKNGLMPDH